MMSRQSTNRRSSDKRRDERGDAGVAFILIIPALLFIVLHLINATQHLYERREAWAVAASASRVGAQGDPIAIRTNEEITIDEGKARAAIARYVGDEGYRLNQAVFDPSDNSWTIEIEKDIDYVFNIPGGLSPTITGKSSTSLRVGVSVEGG